MCSTLAVEFHPTVNQAFLSFLWVSNVISHFEGIPCFEELCERSYQENI
jgi:hypothetical protein